MVLLLIALVAVGGWFGLLAVLAWRTATPDVVAGPPTGAFGPETPALVDFLTGNWTVSEEAAPATLLDLAARGFVAIEEIGPELSLVRLRRDIDTSALNGYERLVLEHVAGLATDDGVIATGALAEGARNLGRWRKSFANAVRDEARSAGLSEARWHAAQRSVLGTAALLPAVVTGVAFAALGSDDRIGAFIGGFVLVVAVLTWAQERVNTERGTPAGAAAAGRWLGVREYLADARFGDQPAAGVTIWGRPLAYAAALGLAARAVVSLPIDTPADDANAWSDYGGMWHRVQVRYRGRGPCGRFFWGYNAFGGIRAGLLATLMLLGPVFVVSVFASALLGFPDNPIRFTFLCAVLIAAVPVVLSVVDLGARRTVRGQIVRQRRFVKRRNDEHVTYRYWMAIDDGRSRLVHAYGIDAELWSRLAEGDVVEAKVGARLGWAYDVRVIAPSRYRTRFQGSVG